MYTLFGQRANSLIIFSVYFCTNLYGKWGRREINNRCV